MFLVAHRWLLYSKWRSMPHSLWIPWLYTHCTTSSVLLWQMLSRQSRKLRRSMLLMLYIRIGLDLCYGSIFHVSIMLINFMYSLLNHIIYTRHTCYCVILPFPDCLLCIQWSLPMQPPAYIRPPVFKDHLVLSQKQVCYTFQPLLIDHLHSKTSFSWKEIAIFVMLLINNSSLRSWLLWFSQHELCLCTGLIVHRAVYTTIPSTVYQLMYYYPLALP
jgi:hypothetical protein